MTKSRERPNQALRPCYPLTSYPQRWLRSIPKTQHSTSPSHHSINTTHPPHPAPSSQSLPHHQVLSTIQTPSNPISPRHRNFLYKRSSRRSSNPVAAMGDLVVRYYVVAPWELSRVEYMRMRLGTVPPHFDESEWMWEGGFEILASAWACS